MSRLNAERADTDHLEKWTRRIRLRHLEVLLAIAMNAERKSATGAKASRISEMR